MDHAIDLQVQARNQLVKFEQTFAALIFGALALSVQFRQDPRTGWVWSLIIGWVCLLLAGIIAGYRIYYLAHFQRLDAMRFGQQQAKSGKEELLQNPLAAQAFALGTAVDPSSGKKWTRAEVEADVQMIGGNVEMLKSELVKLNKRLSCLFKLQVALFLLGVACMILYASADLLKL